MNRGTVVRVLVTVAFLGWFVHQFGLATIVEALGRAPGACVQATLLSLVLILTLALRWQLLLSALDLAPRFSEVIRATFVGSVASICLPSVGGDVVRVMYLARERGTTAAVAVSAAVDRWFGLVALVALGLTATIGHRPSARLGDVVQGVYVAVSVVLVLTVAVALVFRAARPSALARPSGPIRHLDRLVGLGRSVGAAMDLYAGRKLALAQALGMAMVSQLLSIFIYYWLARAVGATSGVFDFLYGVPVVTLVAVVPISLGGIGVSEWAFVQVFADLGMPPDVTLAVSLLNLVARTAGGLIGGAIAWLTGRW